MYIKKRHQDQKKSKRSFLIALYILYYYGVYLFWGLGISKLTPVNHFCFIKNNRLFFSFLIMKKCTVFFGDTRITTTTKTPFGVYVHGCKTVKGGV
jgi:hypothetical protein